MCPKILAGAILDAAGVSFLMYSNGIITGGVMGVAMILNKLILTPVGIVTIILNIPLFLFAWRTLGIKFLFGSFLGMAASSLALDLFELLPTITLTTNPLLAGLFGGFITGVGQGIIYLAGGSTGGIDIIAKAVRRKRPYLNLGKIIMVLNALVFTVYAVAMRQYEAAMYSVVSAFVASKLIDTVLYGLNYTKVCYIIAEKSAEVSKRITEELGRGVTMLYGRGAYSGQEKMVLLCAIKKQQILELKNIVKQTDPDAFIIISESREVHGYGFQFLDDKD